MKRQFPWWPSRPNGWFVLRLLGWLALLLGSLVFAGYDIHARFGKGYLDTYLVVLTLACTFFAFVLALVDWLQQRHDPPLKNVAADEVLAGYRERLHRQAQTLPIDAIFDPEDAPEGCDAVRLMDIYVPMDLVERAATEINERRFREWSLLREAKARPVREQLAQAIAQARGGVRAVLVADAGMGKSSVVGDLIHCCLEPERAEAQAATFRGRALLRLDLRRLASAAADPGFGRRGSAPFWDAVIAELGDELGGNNGGRADSEAAVRQLCGALQNHGLVLLDGLDEVLDPEPRRRVADLVQQLGRELGPGCAILVTARPYVYPEAALRDFRVWQLQPLSVDRPGQGSQAEALVVNWHRALAPRADPGELVESLLTEPERAVLAARPLLLTLLVALALARRTDGARPLPRRRDQLMEQATELFVRRWFQRIERDGPGQLTPALLAALDQGLLRRVLEQLSLEAQQDRREPARGDGGEAVQVEVWSSQFLGVLQDELPTDLRRETDTHAFSRIVVERAGLLFPRGGDVRVRYGYAHRQFQEYLAACALVATDAAGLRERLLQGLNDSPGAWREVVRFSVPRLADTHGTDEAIALVRALLWSEDQRQDQPQEQSQDAAATDAQLQAIAAAGLALDDLRRLLQHRSLAASQQADLADAKAHFDRWYQRLASEPALAPRTRLDLGRIAGRLGDPRPKIVPTGWTPDPEAAFLLDPKQDFDWVQIPTGRFRPGSDEAEQDAYDDEYGGQPEDLPEFAITRVPITCGQFAAFSRGGGYGPINGLAPGWWRFSEQAEDWWHGGNPGLEQYLADPAFPKDQEQTYRRAVAARAVEARRRPWFEGDPRYADWLLPNHPLIGVSWYEAMAFCGWLTAHWRDRDLLADNELIRLPTEIEWERAARGLARRRWPWGDHWRPGAANTEEAEVQATTAVGLFPAASPEGLLDMAGNVWEWTTTRWGPTIGEPAFGWPWKPDDERDDPRGTDLRVVRGGSWVNTPRDCRCAYRGRDGPSGWDFNLGFRVARVSLAHSDF
jgi:formylglycine-generating enzyme required for sulfatase activity